MLIIHVSKRDGCIIFGMNRIPADTDPRSAFYIGQVMVCHVLSCQPEQAKLRLSFKVCHCMKHLTNPLRLFTKTMLVSLQTSSRPGPALGDDKVVGAVSFLFL